MHDWLPDMDMITEILQRIIEVPAFEASLIVAGTLVLALLVRLVFSRLILVLTRKTRTDVDDQLADVVRGPVVVSVILGGMAWAAVILEIEDPAQFITFGLLKTLAVIVWAQAAMRSGAIVLDALSRKINGVKWVQPKTLPLLEIVLKVFVFGAALYFGFVAWNIDVTSWLASAGIVGIAVGFAAKDTLANLFAGIFIVADAPYRVGDFVNLDNSIRGEVVEIGIRSTRILTRDDIEVTVPNAVIANALIINETGGPHQKMRVRVKVSVAYGSDLDQVRKVLLSCVEGVDCVCEIPEPRVRFREFGDSGLLYELLAWIDKPVFRGRVLDTLNTRVDAAFRTAGIEIPYAKYDLYIKSS